MRSAILGFAAGIALLQMQAQLLPFEWLMGLLALAAILLLIGWRSPKGGLGAVVRIAVFNLAGICVGFAWGGLYAHYYLDQQLPSAWEGRDVTVVGTIESLPYRVERGVRFNFLVEKIAPQGLEIPPIPERLSLAWYTAGAFDRPGTVPAAALPELRPGERWQLTVRLKRPHGNANPHGFDYEVWLLEQGLRATGYVRGGALRLDDFVWTFSNAVEASRAALRTRILEHLAGKRYAGVIVALVVGDQRGIAQSD